MIYNEDCILGCRNHVPDNSVDLIITDPPYGIDGGSLDTMYCRDKSYVLGGYVDIPPSEYADFSMKWIKEAERILRPGGSMYVISGYTNLHHVLNALHSTKLKEVNHLIWKYNFGVYTSKKWVSSHYHILYWQKEGGERTFNTYCRYGDSEKDSKGSVLNYKDREDVLSIKREYQPQEVKNKNELPSALLIKLIQYSSNEGDVVCDLFLGGGSAAVVAKGLNRIPLGFEISRPAFDLATMRANNTKQGELLPLMRHPEPNVRTGERRRWTDSEREYIMDTINLMKGHTHKEIVAEICKTLQRGEYAIRNEIKKMGLW